MRQSLCWERASKHVSSAPPSGVWMVSQPHLRHPEVKVQGGVVTASTGLTVSVTTGIQTHVCRALALSLLSTLHGTPCCCSHARDSFYLHSTLPGGE